MLFEAPGSVAVCSAATGSSHTQQTSAGWTSGRVLHLFADARWPRAPRRRGGTAAPGAAGVLLLRGRIRRGHKAPPSLSELQGPGPQTVKAEGSPS